MTGTVITKDYSLDSIKNLILNLYTANKTTPSSYRNALIELSDFIIKNEVTDEDIKECVSDIQTALNSLVQDSKKELNILLEDDFFKIYKEYLDYKENKTSPKLSRIDFFAKNGNHYAKNRPNEFNKVYKKKFDQYNNLISSIKKDIFFSDENKNWSEYILKECEKRIVYLREEFEKEEKAKIEIEQKRKEEVDLFLMGFKNAQQRFICLIKDQHYTNREQEINTYLAFGYEVFVPDANDNKKSPIIFLKPSANYEYTEEFEKALVKIYYKYYRG